MKYVVKRYFAVVEEHEEVLADRYIEKPIIESLHSKKYQAELIVKFLNDRLLTDAHEVMQES